MAVPFITDYQACFDGLVIGKDTNYRITKLEGLEDLEIRSGDVPIPRGVGNIPGLHTEAAKQIILEAAVVGDAHSQTLANDYAAFLAKFRQSDGVRKFSLKEPGYPERFVWARVVGRKFERNPRNALTFRPVLVRMTASDPRIYSEALKTATVGIYSASGGGIDMPEEEFGMDFTTNTASEVTITNAGDANAYPLLRFFGPTDAGTLTGGTLTNTSNGSIFTHTATILAAKTLEADMRRVVTADGGSVPYVHIDESSRYGDWVLPRTPFYLSPGQNTLRYEVTGTTTASLVTVSMRDTWL